ncbi:hypothetical protein [Scytonema sp. PCC 10023]|uniref:hypothetical protein n=1 Tax=Scytonema sp. PCC 10023 TaxID=1680591 RepID=UPI0039C663DE
MLQISPFYAIASPPPSVAKYNPEHFRHTSYSAPNITRCSEHYTIPLRYSITGYKLITGCLFVRSPHHFARLRINSSHYICYLYYSGRYFPLKCS